MFIATGCPHVRRHSEGRNEFSLSIFPFDPPLRMALKGLDPRAINMSLLRSEGKNLKDDFALCSKAYLAERHLTKLA